MLALSMLQPWASLYVLGLKGIETRGWPIPQHKAGRIAVHASKALKRAESDLFHDPVFRDAFAEVGIDTVDALPRAAIIGTIEVVGCHPVETFTAISDRERAFGNYSTAEGPRWGWVSRAPRHLPEPLPCKGALGLWTVPPELLARIPEGAR